MSKKYVTTVSGAVVLRRDTRKISGEYYQINVDCFKMSDGKFHRLNNGMIVLDSETNTPYFKKDAPSNLIKGVVDFVNGNIVYGYFTSKPYKNVMIEEEGINITFLSKELALKSGFKKHPQYPYWTKDGVRKRKNPIDAESLEYTCDRLLGSSINIFKESNNYYKNNILRNSLGNFIDRNYLFGYEFETRTGCLDETTMFKNGIIALKDGSLREEGIPLPFEYVSVPYNRNNLFTNLKEVCDELRQNCTIHRSGSLHLHISGLENSKQNTVSLWILLSKIQDEMLSMFPLYKVNPRIIGKNKNYCQKLSDLNKFLDSIPDANIENKTDVLFKHIFRYTSGGLDPSESINRMTFRHPQSTKWRINSRYHLVNFVTFLFSKKKTVEFRVHTATTNYDTVLNWTYICYAILKYVENNSYRIIQNYKKKITIFDILKEVYPGKITLTLEAYIKYRKQNATEDGESELKADSNKLPSEVCLI